MGVAKSAVLEFENISNSGIVCLFKDTEGIVFVCCSLFHQSDRSFFNFEECVLG
jgi:hypothetical protein